MTAGLDAGAGRGKESSGGADQSEDGGWIFRGVSATVLCVQRKGDGRARERGRETYRADFFMDGSPLGKLTIQDRVTAVDYLGRVMPVVPCGDKYIGFLNVIYPERDYPMIRTAELWTPVESVSAGLSSGRYGLGRRFLRRVFGGGFGVEDVGGGEPGAAKLGDAVTHLVELFGGVGVGVDDDFAAELFGEAEIQVVEVGAGGVGVVFDGYAQFGGAFQDQVDVDGIALAAQNLAAGGMAEDADVWVFEGAEDAGGHLFDGLVEVGVDAGDDDVHLGEGGVFEVEGAVGEDVDFDAWEDADLSFHLGVDFADVLDVCESAGIVHAVGHGEIFAVVGDGDVGQAASESGFGHLADGVAAVGGVGVHVEVAADVGERDEVRESVGGGGFEFAGVFAQLGRDVVEVEGVVDVGLGCGGDDDVVFDAEESVLVQREAALDGALAEGDVVHLRAGEVLEGCAVAAAGKEADVDLEIVAEGEADFVLALGDELVDEREGSDVLHGGETTSGSQAGPVTRRSRSPTVSRPRRREPAGVISSMPGNCADEIADDVGVLLGFVDAEAAGVFAVVLDALEELGDELFAHAGKFGKVAGLGGGFERVDVADLAGGPDEGYGLGAHAGEAEEFEHGGFVFLQELFAERQGAGGEKRLNVGGHALADAGDGEELFGVVGEGGELGGLLLDRLGGTAVGADAEGVGGVDLEEGGGFFEQAGDRDIVHGDAIRVRERMRSLSQYATE